MAYVFRQSICNEAFEGWKFADACKAIRKAGYSGIEIAPFTLAERPVDVTAVERREYSDIIRSEGLEFVGLHWLMVSPKGLHVTTPDAEARARFALIDTLVIHRCGMVRPGEPIVLVAVLAAHRKPALQAVDFLMDYLKTGAPFWKRETGPDGERWIEPRADDYQAREQWKEK